MLTLAGGDAARERIFNLIAVVPANKESRSKFDVASALAFSQDCPKRCVAFIWDKTKPID